MKLELEEAKNKAAATYNSASDFYDHPANTFQPINARDDWWPMVMGSGYRGTIEQLTLTDRERIRLENSRVRCSKRTGHKKHKMTWK